MRDLTQIETQEINGGMGPIDLSPLIPLAFGAIALSALVTFGLGFLTGRFYHS